MTYFLNGGDAPVIKAQNPDTDLTGILGGLGAAWDKAQIDNNSNFRLYRERRSGYAERADQALAILDGGDVQKELERRGLYTDGMLPKEAVRANPKVAQTVIEMGRAAAEQNPDLWSGVDLSDEGVESEVNARLQAEYEEAEQILDMMPGGRGVAEIVGAIGGITADIKNAPFLLLGGGSGSLLRVMGREAAINMAAETAFLSDQFEMADRLNIPDPDVKTQLLMAAAGGAVFGGLVEGGARALAYWRTRNTVTPVRGYDSASTDAMVTAAEEALVANQNPLRAVQEAVAGTEAKPYILENPINPDKPPLILSRKQQDLNYGQPRRIGDYSSPEFRQWFAGSKVTDSDGAPLVMFHGTDAQFDTFDISQSGRNDRGWFGRGFYFTPDPDTASFYASGAKSSDGAINANVRPVYLRAEKPFYTEIDMLSHEMVKDIRDKGFDSIIVTYNGVVKEVVVYDQSQIRSAFDGASNAAMTDQAEAALDEIATARMGDKKPFTKKIRSDVKVHPDGPLAQELRAQGVTAKSYPGLFSRKGAKDIDNLVASEWDDAIPGISRVTGTDGIYLSRQGVIDALVEENAGRRLATDLEAELQAREADVAASKRSPEEDFLAGADSGIEGRLFIDQNQLGLLTDQDVATMVDDWLAARNWSDLITPQERAELVAAMRSNGGDAEYLVERMWERDLDYAALPPQEAPDYDIPFGENELASEAPVGSGVGTGGGPDANPVPARGGGEGLADDAGQTFIPGTDRIDTGLSQRQRAEMAARQQQSKIRRLDQTRIEDTEGTLFGGAQSDLFSDPASPQARPILDDMSASLRDDILKDGDFKLDLGDGKGERSVSAILDDLDEGDEFADTLDLCGKPMVKE